MMFSREQKKQEALKFLYVHHNVKEDFVATLKLTRDTKREREQRSTDISLPDYQRERARLNALDSQEHIEVLSEFLMEHFSCGQEEIDRILKEI